LFIRGGFIVTTATTTATTTAATTATTRPAPATPTAVALALAFSRFVLCLFVLLVDRFGLIIGRFIRRLLLFASLFLGLLAFIALLTFVALLLGLLAFFGLSAGVLPLWSALA
jgi:hypothetical protein